MAVYKPTYCQPFLNSIDIRVAIGSEDMQPCEWLTCKVDSSNKKITGYKVRILDSANNQIFPSLLSNNGEGYISSVEDLPEDSSDESVNTGLNGSILKIPFFQNYNYRENASTQTVDGMKLPSFNAVYYTPCFKANYLFEESISHTAQGIDENHLELSFRRAAPESYMVGDTILVPSDTQIADSEDVCEAGLFKIQSLNYSGVAPATTTHATLERLSNINRAALEGHEVVITKGSNHNKRYLCIGGSYTPVEEGTSLVARGIWVDIEGNPIELNLEGNTYKWEITLYQGQGTEDGKTITLSYLSGEETVYVKFIDYISEQLFDYNNCDIVLNSGKILGSTNKRIQIASALDDSAILPIGTLNSPLVLQGTYAQLLDSNHNPIASRAYVQNYDTSFGHVYPITGGFSREDVAAAEQICFYKHSNNVEDVLAKERVDCATILNLAIYQEVDGRWQVNKNLGLPVIDGYQTVEGSYVLVKNQTRQQENGVYIAHQTGTGWTRSGSYKTWGDFIGAILFVVNGNTNGATNWESMASAGGSLFTTDASSGDSPLVFTPEKPITLFSGRLSRNVDLVREKMPHEYIVTEDGDREIEHVGNTYKVHLYWFTLGAQPELKLWKIVSDGVIYSPGQRVLCYNNSHKIIQIISMEEGERSPGAWLAPDVIITYTIVDSAETNDYINVLNGNTYGGHIVKLLSNSVLIDDNVKYAYILKNGLTYTYISPYTGLREGMFLKLLNNQKVEYSDDTSSQWIKIYSDDPTVKSVNTTVWRIAHKELDEPLASDSQSDPLIPYAYEVRSFYRVSDENPFYVYEEPYLLIVQTDPPQRYEPLENRYVVYNASYEHFQQSSWESYRWVLLDHDGNVVQDTGIKYEGDLKVTFYGLSNETPDNVYKAVLYVTDDLKNTLSAEMDLETAEGTTTFSTDFKAEFDCTTHSIILTNVFEENDTEYSIYRRELQKYSRIKRLDNGLIRVETEEYRGEWKPVLLKTRNESFRDFNIKAGHSYQYVIYPTGSSQAIQQFANAKETGPYAGSAVPIVTNWDEWSLIELKPVKNAVDAPILRKSYEVDLDNIWLFKYGLETGSQNQNFQKSEIQTLGQYQKIGYGKSNFISGDVSCYLGSEIVPYSKNGYIERMRKSINTPLSTNEKAFMLQQWRKIASSPNPKLLRDMKGQSWIVQIMSNNNTPKNFYSDQPDTISFSWKQIDNTDNVIIIGDGTKLPKVCDVDSVWKKVL